MKNKLETTLSRTPQGNTKAPGAVVYLSNSAKQTYDLLRVRIGAHGYAETLELVLEKLNQKQEVLKELFNIKKI